VNSTFLKGTSERDFYDLKISQSFSLTL